MRQAPTFQDLILKPTILGQDNYVYAEPCHGDPRHRCATSNQIDHFAISLRFRGCLMNVRNKRGADIGNSPDHFLIVATLRVRTAAVSKKQEYCAKGTQLLH